MVMAGMATDNSIRGHTAEAAVRSDHPVFRLHLCDGRCLQILLYSDSKRAGASRLAQSYRGQDGSTRQAMLQSDLASEARILALIEKRQIAAQAEDQAVGD